MAPIRVLCCGSSGGGGATLADGAESSLRTLRGVFGDAGLALVHLQFVECSTGLDVATGACGASLWVMQEVQVHCAARGTLAEVNLRAAQQDQELAEAVRRGGVDAIVIISADVEGVNKAVLAAAAERQVPVVGTGGTSVGLARAVGVRVISGGGSVATTPTTRAIAFASALSGHFRLPNFVPRRTTGDLSMHSVLDGCLPAFLAMFVAHSASSLLLPAVVTSYLRARAPRVAAAVVAAVAGHQAAGLGEFGVLAGALAGGCLNPHDGASSSVLAALLAGIGAGELARRLLALAFRAGTPATAATIIAVGGAGLACGLAADTILAPPIAIARHALLAAVETALVAHSVLGAVCGASLGILFVWGSQRGLYHLVFLPAILIEMETGAGALLGTLDEATLAVVSLALCTASWLAPRGGGTAAADAERSAAASGASVNFWWGDFIEAGYPLMNRDSVVLASVYIGSGASGAAAFYLRVRSSAYLPLPMAVALADNPAGAAVCFALAFVPPFATALIRNLWVGESGRKRQ